jgi:hypothetical protein
LGRRWRHAVIAKGGRGPPGPSIAGDPAPGGEILAFIRRWTEEDDAVNVVRHDDERIQNNVRTDLRRVKPLRPHDGTESVDAHPSLVDVTEEVAAFVRREFERVRFWSPVIVKGMPKR